MRRLLPCLVLVLGLTACQKPGAGANKAAGRPPTQVVAVEASVEPVTEALSLVGSVLANESVEIKSEIAGKVEKILFQEGQEVQAGEVLIELDSTKLGDEVAEAEAAFKLSKANYQRNKQLYADRLISPQEFEQSAAAFQADEALLALRKRRLGDTRMLAPFHGIVSARNVSPGQVIAVNTVLTWLIDLDPVKVEINVPERYIGRLALGQAIEIVVAAYPDRTFKGEVFFITPFVEPATRTALIKARIPNPDRLLKPGMFANLELTLQVRTNSVVIPEAALSRILDNNRALIFVVDGQQTAQMRTVKVGMHLPARVEILEGLRPGELVVVEGTQKIGPGSPVRLAPPEAAEPYRTPSAPKPAAPIKG